MENLENKVAFELSAEEMSKIAGGFQKPAEKKGFFLYEIKKGDFLYILEEAVHEG